MARYHESCLWIDFARMCPKCGKRIPKYRRRCQFCGLPVKNRCGKVYAK